MINLEAQKIVILVFAMEQCPACEHMLPRLLGEAQALSGQPAVYGKLFAVNPETQPPDDVIPILIFDAAADNAEVQKLADRFEVQATPTTIVAQRGAGAFKVEGSLANNQIQWLLIMAAEASK